MDGLENTVGEHCLLEAGREPRCITHLPSGDVEGMGGVGGCVPAGTVDTDLESCDRQAAQS